MKFKIPGSKQEVWVNIQKYKIQWDKPTRSKMQSAVKDFLYPYWKTHIVCEEFKVPRSRLRVDIINFTKRVAVEVQGKQHIDYVPFFQGNPTQLFQQWGRDAKKERFLEYNGYQLIQILPEDMNNLSREFFLKTFGLDL